MSTVDNEKKKVYELDLKDRKILYLLSEDGKMAVTDIAKDVGLSKDAVTYRINRLVERGIILYFIPIINVHKLGFFSYYIYLQLENLKSETDSELLNYLKESKYTMFVGSCFGSYDVVAQIFVKNTQELDIFLRELRNRYDSNIRDFTLLLATKEQKLPAKYLAESQSLNLPLRKKETDEKNIILDEKDMQILAMLSRDAKIPTYKIASELNISSDAVIYRIKKLVDLGVIDRFIAAIDVTKLGYRWHIVLLQMRNLTDEKEKILLSFIKGHPHMLYLTKAIGKYDLAIDVNAKNEKHFNDVLMELRIKFQDIIKAYDTILMFEEYKYTYFPDVIMADVAEIT